MTVAAEWALMIKTQSVRLGCALDERCQHTFDSSAGSKMNLITGEHLTHCFMTAIDLPVFRYHSVFCCPTLCTFHYTGGELSVEI